MGEDRIPQFSHVVWAAIVVTSSLAHAGADRMQVAEKYVPRLEKILTENIVPFWHEKSLDRANGGYTISFDSQGRLKEPVTKMIVTQARQVWLFPGGV
jgi:hypothetical protein